MFANLKATELRKLVSTYRKYHDIKGYSRMKKAELITELDPLLPSTVIADPFRLGQILQNLIGNAIKFTTIGIVKLKLSKEESTDADVTIKFEVIDTGIGIAKENQEKIFEKYIQAEKNTEGTYGGTGLGLNISKNLIALMGGKLSLHSEIGKGANFYFSLPFKISDQIVEDTDRKDIIREANFNKAKLLVVDDNEINLVVIGKYLKKWNIEIDKAIHGKQAVEKASHTNYDLILMDLFMPEMDGFEATKAIKNLENSNAPVVALSANNASEISNLLKDAGFDTYLNKPFKPQELLDILDIYLVNN
jgi:CheY-like chemotaxis protein